MSPSAGEACLVWRGEVIGQDAAPSLADVARQRSQTYWWLSELYLESPDQTRIAGILAAARTASATHEENLLQPSLDEFVAAAESSDPVALAVEHARLFAGMGASYGPDPPYEYLHAAAEPQVDRVINVKDAYREAGFDRIDVHAVPQDHLAVELRFMALLAANESAAWGEAASERAQEWLRREEAFLDRHLLFWVPRYCERMAEQAREPFFAALGRMTATALALDRRSVDDALHVPSSP